MEQLKIVLKETVNADKQKVWNYYTQPLHITKWNFADPSWHCPIATNDMVVGGRYYARMEEKNGSFGFDFDAVYTEIKKTECYTYEFDGRLATFEFKEIKGHTEITITFDPETENPIELQRKGWEAILQNFKNYVETN